MNRTNKVIVVVVLVLVVLFGVGQFFASSNFSSNPTGSSTTATTPAVIPTQVVAYAASQPAPSTPVKSGSCWTSSIAAPFRTDAWRCAVGNGISDPCFQIPGNSSDLLCGVNPAAPDSTSTFVLKLTQPLPAPQALGGTPPSNWAWLVELQGGTLCTPFTGTLPFTANGETGNYSCAPGALGTNLLIFGDLNASSSPWTASIGTLSQITSSLPVVATSSTIPVVEVWQ